MTEWLTDDEQRVWRAFLDATQGLFEALDRQLQRDAGLTLGDYEILVRLSEAEGARLRMSELADRARYSRSRVSHAIGRLERAGLIRRDPCETDGRGTFAVLTDDGRAVLAAAAPGHVAAVRDRVFRPLTPHHVGELERISVAIGHAAGIGAIGEAAGVSPARREASTHSGV
jgi:DNA-binding MarR family transcriptional regulator